MNPISLNYSRRMVMSFLVFAMLSLFLSASRARADDGGVAVLVKAGKKVCFSEEIQEKGSHAFFHYTVNNGGSLDIMANVQNPDGSMVWISEKGTEERVLFKANKAGNYKFCFSNEMSTVTDKVVAFSVTVTESAELEDAEAGPTRPRDLIQRTVRRIEQSLREIEELQFFLRTRERRHRSTIEVANTRVIIWSFLEIVFIVGTTATSMYYFRRLFSTKRVV